MSTAQLINTLRDIEREQKALATHSAKSGDFARSTPRACAQAAEKAAASARNLRVLMNLAHCQAVELGIADRRADAAYADGTASLGFGREVRIEKRAPAAQGSAS